MGTVIITFLQVGKLRHEEASSLGWCVRILWASSYERLIFQLISEMFITVPALEISVLGAGVGKGTVLGGRGPPRILLPGHVGGTQNGAGKQGVSHLIPANHVWQYPDALWLSRPAVGCSLHLVGGGQGCC